MQYRSSVSVNGFSMFGAIIKSHAVVIVSASFKIRLSLNFAKFDRIFSALIR